MITPTNNMTIRATKSRTTRRKTGYQLQSKLGGILISVILGALIRPSNAAGMGKTTMYMQSCTTPPTNLNHSNNIYGKVTKRLLNSLRRRTLTTTNRWQSWFTTKKPVDMCQDGGLYLNADGKYMTYRNGKLIKTTKPLNPAQLEEVSPYKVVVKGAGSKDLNGIYRRKECKEGPPKGWSDKELFLNYKGWLKRAATSFKALQTADKSGYCEFDYGNWCEYMGTGFNLLSDWASTPEEKKKEHQKKLSEIWYRMSGGRHYYEKNDGCCLFFTTKPDSVWDAEIKKVKQSWSNETAKWRLSDKDGNVYYTANCRRGNINVSETKLMINPPKNGWEINDFNELNVMKFDVNSRGISPPPTVEFRQFS